MSAPRDPEELEATALPAVAEISPATTVGAVHLTVSNLDASLAYYREAIGLDVLASARGVARLGAGTRELLVLVEHAGARPEFPGLREEPRQVQRRCFYRPHIHVHNAIGKYRAQNAQPAGMGRARGTIHE